MGTKDKSVTLLRKAKKTLQYFPDNINYHRTKQEKSELLFVIKQSKANIFHKIAKQMILKFSINNQRLITVIR